MTATLTRTHPAVTDPASDGSDGSDDGRIARIVGVGTALPDHEIDQRDAKACARDVFGRHGGIDERLLSVFDHAGVDRRHFCVPLDWFRRPRSFGERNDRYETEAVALSTVAARRALAAAGTEADDVDALLFVSSTGVATPSLDARLALELGCRPDVLRDATFGHGCAGGVAGLARAAALASSGATTLLVATELCSLTFRHDDTSTTNLVSTALFSDGAAAVVLDPPRPHTDGEPSGAGGSGPHVIGSSRTLWPDTRDVMGFSYSGNGMQVILDRNVPALVRRRFSDSVDQAMASASLDVDAVHHFLMHPGGAKVLTALQDAIGASPAALRRSHEVLRRHGNMSAPTALFVLADAMSDAESSAHSHDPPGSDRDGSRAPTVGDVGLLSAMGPGFAAEHVVVRW